MTRRHIKALVALGAVLLGSTLAAGAGLVISRTWQSAKQGAELSLERTAHVVENVFNRQLLQADSALAGLPALFAAVADNGDALSPEAAARVLEAFKVQNLSFRDVTLLRADGSVFAMSKARVLPKRAAFAAEILEARRESTATLVHGPVRNALSGEWSLFIARTIAVPNTGSFVAVAEMPLAALTSRLADASGEIPDLRIALERADGRLLASLPHDERRTGRVLENPVSNSPQPFGDAFDLPDPAGGPGLLAVVRPTLYGDIRIAVTLDSQSALAPWARDRERILAMVAIAESLVFGCMVALLLALRRQERLEDEKHQAREMLESAIEAMSDGFVMWDRDDRLVTCNSKYRELYALSAPAIRAGARFEDIMRFGAENGQYPQAGTDIDGWLKEMIAWHRGSQGTMERLLPDGRWLLVTERTTASGGIVGIRTDITALKTALTELEAANERARAAMAEVQAQNSALIEREGRIRFLAHHDALTRLPNRVLFRTRLDEMLQGLRRPTQSLALLYLDLDKFKDVNDTLGHPVGDALLEAVGERLQACMRESDIVARLGGDEFALAFVAQDATTAGTLLAERIIAQISAPFDLGGRTVTIGVSVGIAVADDAEIGADTLLKNADMALYEAKAAGRGSLRLFEADMASRLHARLEIEQELRGALDRNEFHLLYQPIVDLARDRVCGFEALLRWRHPEHGLIGPGLFVPIAEETGLIDRIGEFVLRQACADAALLPPGTTIAVNLSPVQMRSDALFETVTAALAESRLDPTCLELEITETALLEDNERVATLLKRLRGTGARIVLDDFGTGYSSLSYLQTFPFQKVKIDQSFVREMTTRSNSAAIVSAIVGLADELGITTTAEGVETDDQLAFVRRVGCGQAQGYYLGQPKPILAAVQVMAEGLPFQRSVGASVTSLASKRRMA